MYECTYTYFVIVRYYYVCSCTVVPNRRGWALTTTLSIYTLLENTLSKVSFSNLLTNDFLDHPKASEKKNGVPTKTHKYENDIYQFDFSESAIYQLAHTKTHFYIIKH